MLYLHLLIYLVFFVVLNIDLRKKFFHEILEEFGGNLHYIICGGANLDKKYVKWFRSIGINILNGYGITECSPVVAVNRNHYYKDGSVGQICRDVLVKIIDDEICVKGKIVMQGYYKDSKSTKEVLQDGYFHTGDLGYIDEDGVIFYVQRIKRIIISSGYNIYPEYVERILKKNEYIKDVCVVGVPHPYKKEIAKAFIILKDNVEETYTVKKEIMDYAKMNLAHYMIPREYIYKKEFPKTKMAKTDYRALRDELINR